MKLIKIFTTILFLLLTSPSYSQSDFDFTQRWFNESLFNPASTGNNFTTGLFLHSRNQWVSLDGSPQTYAISFDTYVDNLKSAFGVAVYADKIGYLSKYNARISYAYFLNLGRRNLLSFGLSAGMLNMNSSVSSVKIDNVNDPIIYNANDFSPDFDFGIEYKGALKAGISVRHLAVSSELKKHGVHAFNLWGYLSSRFNLSSSLCVEPAFSINYRDGIGRYETGALFYFLKNESFHNYNDKFWVGAMYRLNSQFAILTGINITKQIRLGYSFDYGTNDLMKISSHGTHEIFLSWHFNRIFYKDKLCPAYKDYNRRK